MRKCLLRRRMGSRERLVQVTIEAALPIRFGFNGCVTLTRRVATLDSGLPLVGLLPVSMSRSSVTESVPNVSTTLSCELPLSESAPSTSPICPA